MVFCDCSGGFYGSIIIKPITISFSVCTGKSSSTSQNPKGWGSYSKAFKLKMVRQLEEVKGIVVRIDSKPQLTDFDNWLESRNKIVRPEFLCEVVKEDIEQWINF